MQSSRMLILGAVAAAMTFGCRSKRAPAEEASMLGRAPAAVTDATTVPVTAPAPGVAIGPDGTIMLSIPTAKVAFGAEGLTVRRVTDSKELSALRKQLKKRLVPPSNNSVDRVIGDSPDISIWRPDSTHELPIASRLQRDCDARSGSNDLRRAHRGVGGPPEGHREPLRGGGG